MQWESGTWAEPQLVLTGKWEHKQDILAVCGYECGVCVARRLKNSKYDAYGSFMVNYFAQEY